MSARGSSYVFSQWYTQKYNMKNFLLEDLTQFSRTKDFYLFIFLHYNICLALSALVTSDSHKTYHSNAPSQEHVHRRWHAIKSETKEF